MRIDQSKSVSVEPAKKERAQRREADATDPAKADSGVQVHLSHSDAVKSAAAADAPDPARAARVAQLKSAVADGTYKPDLEKLAHKLADVLGGTG